MTVAALRSLLAPFRSLAQELAKFGVVGAINYVVDVGIFNLLITGPLDNKPLTSKGISTAIAATSSYFMNRHWTWKDRARRGLLREYGTFVVLSVIALLITVGCLAFGEYVLHQDSVLARNFWGNIVGIGAAMVFRFWAFKRWVFTAPEPEKTEDVLPSALV